MTVHIELIAPFTMCGADGDRIGVRFIVANFPKVLRLMREYGCQDCIAELKAAVLETKPLN